MSPPIRDGSGDSIGAIRLGDGSEIAEVRTGAGDVLFSGGIPASGDYQWYINEGSGTTEIADVGGVDLSINFGQGSWASAPAAVEGTILDFDSDNDRAETTSNVSADTFTFGGWVRPQQSNSTGKHWAEIGNATGSQGGVNVRHDTPTASNQTIEVDVDGAKTFADEQFVSVGSWGFYALRADFSAPSMTLQTYDNSQNLVDKTITPSSTASGSYNWAIGASSTGTGKRTAVADYDFHFYADGSTLTDAEIDGLWQATQR